MNKTTASEAACFLKTHDIGKIVIPDNIILKAGKLTEDEYEIIKSHTTKGAEIIEKLIHFSSVSPYSGYSFIMLLPRQMENA